MSFFHPHHAQARRQFLKKSFLFMGSFAPSSVAARHAVAREVPREGIANASFAPAQPAAREFTAMSGVPELYQVFDAHLHSPSEAGDVWQWYPVTKTFDEFARYLEQTGVNKGIINNVRCQLAKSPADFVSGNREVARFVERYKGKFLGACVVNPLFIDEALREIEDCR